LLAEIDTQATYENVTQEQTLTDLPEDSKINMLVAKLVERQREMEKQQEALQ